MPCFWRGRCGDAQVAPEEKPSNEYLDHVSLYRDLPFYQGRLCAPVAKLPFSYCSQHAKLVLFTIDIN